MFWDTTRTKQRISAEQIILAKPRAADTTLHSLDVNVPVHHVGDTTDIDGLYAAIHDGAKLGRSL